MAKMGHLSRVLFAATLSFLLYSLCAPASAQDDYGWLQRGVVQIIAYKPGNEKETGAGIFVGFDAKKSALILTAHHVVKDAVRLEVIFFDKQWERFHGMFFQQHEDLDIAVITVDPLEGRAVPSGLPMFTIGEVAKLKEGDRVSTIGHPYDLAWLTSINTNILARLNYQGDFRKFRFTKTAIQRGSSGGPIFSEQGALIGVVAKVDPIHAVAVKIDEALKVLRDDWSILTTNLVSQSWPPNAISGGTYIVQAKGQTMTIPYLKLPANFTISFAPEVQQVSWSVHTLEFGVNATLDLSAPQIAPPPAANGADRHREPLPLVPHDVSLSVHGKAGGAGAPGKKGREGIFLRLTIGSVIPRGSLWIRTDGGPGGAGGRGGRGQNGAAARCAPIMGSPYPVHGGLGGDGGNGGSGGKGGTQHAWRLR